MGDILRDSENSGVGGAWAAKRRAELDKKFQQMPKYLRDRDNFYNSLGYQSKDKSNHRKIRGDFKELKVEGVRTAFTLRQAP